MHGKYNPSTVTDTILSMSETIWNLDEQKSFEIMSETFQNAFLSSNCFVINAYKDKMEEKFKKA